jgi:hypothetical protein
VLKPAEVARYWEANAETWTRHARAGYDIYRDGLNTPAFLDMLPPVGGLCGLDIGIAGFRHQLADQLAAHSAAAAGDYRGPPHEFGHVRPPLRAGADPDMVDIARRSAGDVPR